jgi:hypothetical protein
MLSSADDTMDIRPYWIPAWVNPRLEGIFHYISDNEMPDKAVSAESAYVGLQQHEWVPCPFWRQCARVMLLLPQVPRRHDGWGCATLPWRGATPA